VVLLERFLLELQGTAIEASVRKLVKTYLFALSRCVLPEHTVKLLGTLVASRDTPLDLSIAKAQGTGCRIFEIQ
jgi:hypothetical protein